MIQIKTLDVELNITPRKSEYDEYLRNHISNVRRTWYNVLYPALLAEGNLSAEVLAKVCSAVDSHDLSKYSPDEYSAYLNHFYPHESCTLSKTEVQTAYDLAWLHHQKTNPHHWQYWVLLRDEGKLEALDMPIEYIIEMACDWHSFSATYPESTAYHWYSTEGSKMTLSKATKATLTTILEYLKDPLSPSNEEVESDG